MSIIIFLVPKIFFWCLSLLKYIKIRMFDQDGSIFAKFFVCDMWVWVFVCLIFF